ncbi:MAG: chemotaxis protein CheW, partial [Gemmatimonadaceae bacterium]
TEEIVVKPLGRQLKGIPAFAGATIMGDGRVSLILDVLGLAQCSGVLSEARERNKGASTVNSSFQSGNSETLLLFGLGVDRRLAVPLSVVARLEEFERSSVEWSDGREVVQYRDGIMQLIRLSDVLGTEDTSDKSGLLQIIVHTTNDQSVGFVVDRIIDIVETSAAVQNQNRTSPSLAGTAVIQGKITDILDLEVLIELVRQEFVRSSRLHQLTRAA